jgi:DNA-binding SARP family transcriptional activator
MTLPIAASFAVDGRIVLHSGCEYVGGTLAETRIHLCGRLVARIEGRRVEAALPGRQGRLLFAYLCANRRRALGRAELMDAVWPTERPDAADAALNALLSKLRRHVPLEGRTAVAVALAADAWIDVEVAGDALHRAEGAAGRGDWLAAYGPARVVQHIAQREVLPGEDARWVAALRRDLATAYLRSLELVGEASLAIGGSEVDTAERAARALVAQAPLRESGHRLLMQVLEQRGNRADALAAYDELRVRLRQELGAPPSRETQELHKRLLG